jgi:hypothetical protein
MRSAMPPGSALAVEPEWVHAVFELLGLENKSIEEIESEVRSMVPDAMTARRLIDWIPEVVALVIVAHISDVKLPSTFSATTAEGRWVELQFDSEPVIALAYVAASDAIHSEHKQHALRVASRSATMAVVNRTLDTGHALEDLRGGSLSGPAMIGIPAEIYSSRKPPIWKRLLGR